MAVTQSIVDAVCERLDGARVRVLALEIGTLSGVVPDAVRFCFDLAAEGTPLAGARLEIAEPPGLARCRVCEAEFRLDDLIALCPCGSADVGIISGRELRIRSMEVL
ncbi:hydrogenase maturation nickel metallochaperone HypA/HybF [Allosalinactinospora lopnorensis]|uniref:hydrogenase maturation nickel metallochaperone HypA/HybF n=1 Tax=Allosalinactinospora lopnorensis TaxID=1352348 RepID=UPI001F2B0641|nr:hydrogenase maturation nickel metallochaperone HypA [Allosalinactinospora lopnorensis]